MALLYTRFFKQPEQPLKPLELPEQVNPENAEVPLDEGTEETLCPIQSIEPVQKIRQIYHLERRLFL